MDYSTITQELIEKRFSVLPEKIQTVLDSEKIQEETRKISGDSYLSEEQSLIVEQLTALILLGFVSQKDLQAELIENAGLTDENAAKISQTVKEKILASAGGDLGRVYSPMIEPTANEMKAEAAKETVSIRTPIDAIAPQFPTRASGTSPTTAPEPAPFVIYQDNQQSTEVRKPLVRSFSLPFNLFKSQAAAPRNDVRATIETTDNDKNQDKEAKDIKITLPRRTVHYSEFRTPVSPFENNSMNSGNFGESAISEKPLPPAPAPQPAKSESRFEIPQKESAPENFSADENIINLKDL